MAVQHPDFQPVFQENFMLDRDALIIRNKLRVTFAKAEFQIDNDLNMLPLNYNTNPSYITWKLYESM